ncbi:MAG: Fe-S cluster assembly protein SufD [Flavobacteriales bacterium]|nr:Fe-S cluster assembly protein SufD [Flavobacteriales bacterium]
MIAELTKKDLIIEQLNALTFHAENEHFKTLRQAARTALADLEFPTSKTEYWKYTRLGKVTNKTYTAQSAATVDPTPFLIPGLDAHILVLVNGRFKAELSSFSSQPGVTVLALQEAKTASRTAFTKHFNQYTVQQGEIFMELNNAYHTDGIYLEVEKGIVAEKPYHVLNITTGNQNIVQPRNLIVSAPDSQIKLIESFVTIEAQESFTNSIAEFYVAENASVEYNKIQSFGPDNYQIATEQVYQESNSRFTVNTATFNGTLMRNNLNVEVNGTYCETNLGGLYLGKGKDHIDNHTVIDHKQPHCNSNEVYKGVLDDESTGVFNGKVFVRQDAQITNAFQQNNNILLSDNATVNSKPELEIYADDVKCSHGSTTGQIDDEAIFYLQSRGISKRNAINLMINAFAKDALEKITIEALEEYINTKIEARFTK